MAQMELIALHAADARFARHAALAALPLVAGWVWLRTHFPPKRSLDGAPDWAEDDKKGQKQIPCGNDNQEELRQKKKRILCGNDNKKGKGKNNNQRRLWSVMLRGWRLTTAL